MGYIGRDVEIVELDGSLCLVGACDSCGAVGSKDRDIINVPAALVGQLTARVVLMEVVAVGGRPVMMTVGICAEREPTGREIIKGIEQELAAAGLTGLSLAVSTEKNFTPSQTGLGIGVTGTCRKSDLRIGGSMAGDQVFVLGLPRVGDEVADASDTDLPAVPHLQALLTSPGIRDVVPVGSRGILAEIRDLARHSQTAFSPVPDPVPDMLKSAGPSTCVVFTAEASWQPADAPSSLRKLPLSAVGSLTDYSKQQ
ncbi:MAG: hypothetical protein MI802_11860 [Desulfobacterales bacterium]|nr:hypothetical protein [Desulfobacterales bacterium]